MAKVLLGIGSNIDPEINIRNGIEALSSCLKHILLSPVYESRAIGFTGDNFLNLVVAGHTHLPLGEFATVLRDIEYRFGRERDASKYSSRYLDIDILTYDDLVGEFHSIALPRDEILNRAFVLKPLADLVPDALHPQVQKNYRDLWCDFDQEGQDIWLSPFSPVLDYDELDHREDLVG
ncbi:2-amino-4-hydroxy-6-hydroxymethyldihydropteridine diphosphokinase [Agarilytica rhodophyticola]|uniref:2-amino-4-hydroxy-6- hydroxymethyldihydropteridine diphosphokinase n=1 Tax=Agarilytica rhodophyticola TaxID=1737490 RepID=UPI000B342839|nr:2-amino-4-hydroxy-6-hydroxymethyldihydropteridine diphosphokinase [Agarilytica rhodophyticola]